MFLKQKSNYAIAEDKEHERVISNWIEHQPKWENSCSEKNLIGSTMIRHFFASICGEFM